MTGASLVSAGRFLMTSPPLGPGGTVMVATDGQKPIVIPSAGGNGRVRAEVRSEEVGKTEEEERGGEGEEKCEGKSMEREERC